MTDDDLRQVFAAYRKAADEHDLAKTHPDLGRRDARGFSAKGRLQHASDVLREAGQRWESTRRAALAQQAEHEAGQLPLDSA
jgi:hypothetical protein